jgi:hypothetical protein
METYSQAHQDIFIRKVLKNKLNGYFIEIGSCDPIFMNNTYVLEKNNNWKGIMVEYDSQYLEKYKEIRKNSYHIIQDATTIDWKFHIKNANLPYNIDYLQIDLEVHNGSTIQTLNNLDKEIMDDYKFAVITFEHDIYTGNHYNTRELSREIFEKRGYKRIFSDVSLDNNPFEDWYIHPELVDTTHIDKFKNSLHHTIDIKNFLDTII